MSVSGRRYLPVADAELTAGAETLEKWQALPVGEVALLTTGRECCREFRVPSRNGFWKFSVRTRG